MLPSLAPEIKSGVPHQFADTAADGGIRYGASALQRVANGFRACQQQRRRDVSEGRRHSVGWEMPRGGLGSKLVWQRYPMRDDWQLTARALWY